MSRPPPAPSTAAPPAPGRRPPAASRATSSSDRQPPAASRQPPADTIIAVATAPGPATCALLRASGPAAIALASRFFRCSPSLAEAMGSTSLPGILDWDGLPVPARAAVFRAPRSYTREDMVEIVLPGAPPLYGSILSSFLSHDLPDGTVRLALPGEFTLRAFRAGRIDLSQAEAVASLIRATSDFEERAAERQLRGELKERVEAISSEILGTLALAEAALDFPDEDLPEIAPRALSGRTGHLVEAMEELLSSSALRLADTGALRVALAGFPNAGKSSLLNALLGRPAAIVAGVAGTTRDPVRGTVAGAGREIEWIDLAGFEVLPPPEEEAGADEIARAVGRLTREELSTADVVVWVADAADGSRLEGSLALFRSLPACRKVLALNKSDLLMAADLDTLRSLPDRPAVLSAIRGQGLVDLIARVAESPGAAEAPQFLITARQEAALLRAREMIRKGSTLLGEGGGYELLSVDLRDALSALGEITGREVGEKVLDAIFGQFCIGK